MKKYLLIFLLFACFQALAQEKHKVEDGDYQNYSVEMADQFRQDGKIYVVVAVASVILSGLILYAVKIDKKVSKLEKELEMKNSSKTSY